MEVSLKSPKKHVQRTAEFKQTAVQRMLAGEPVSRLSRELNVRRTQLYRWRDAVRKAGAEGLRPIGRPRWSDENQVKDLESRVAALQGKVGQQTMVIDFLRRAFKRVEELRRQIRSSGVTASTERSER
jgi:transposase